MYWIILLLVLTLLILWQFSAESYTITPALLRDLTWARNQPGIRRGRYLYYPYMGYPGFLLQQRLDLNNDHGRLMATCDSMPNCAAFDSGGKLYTSVIPRGGWSCTFPSPDTGLFVKDYSLAPGGF